MQPAFFQPLQITVKAFGDNVDFLGVQYITYFSFSLFIQIVDGIFCAGQSVRIYMRNIPVLVNRFIGIYNRYFLFHMPQIFRHIVFYTISIVYDAVYIAFQQFLGIFYLVHCMAFGIADKHHIAMFQCDILHAPEHFPIINITIFRYHKCDRMCFSCTDCLSHEAGRIIQLFYDGIYRIPCLFLNAFVIIDHSRYG